MKYIEMKCMTKMGEVSCRLYNKHSKKILILFNALRPRTNSRSVFYNRLTWVDEFDCSCLYISDPTMLKDRSLRGGYYQGDSNFFGIENIADVILKVCAMLNITEDDIILYGSSQGGFAALALNAYLRRATVFAESPQTDLSILTSANSKADRLAMLKSVYELTSFNDLDENLKYRIDIDLLYKEMQFIPQSSKIIVKETDLDHIHEHINPLIEKHPTIGLEVLRGDFGKGGHSAIDRTIIKERITDIIHNGSDLI